MKTKTFKFNLIFFLMLVIVFTVSGFVMNTETEEGEGGSTDLTNNKELKKDVFNQILNNKELFTEFMNTMMTRNQTMNWMMGNENMMQYMFSGNHLGYMMQQNPEMNQMMMQNMMNTIQSDSTYTNQWNQMMNNNHYGMGMHHGGMMMHN